MDLATSIALSRFGLGPDPATVATASPDPRGWVSAQVGPAEEPSSLADLPSSATTLQAIYQARREGPEALGRAVRTSSRRTFAREVRATAEHRITTDTPFVERMVMFWSNHFTVSRTKAVIGPAIPAFEREAIRPHVFGRFEDMLQAVVAHPVMLDYLDNHLSVGPSSRAGRRTGRSLNENLAREVLELHTLGVDGGYTQDDVRTLALVLTGWTHGGVVPPNSDVPITGSFVFRERMHEPGRKRVLGTAYRQGGVEQGQAVLADLARHPSTATFLATKLVRHFVADEPDRADVEAVAQVFRDTDGDLAEVSRAVVGLPSVWATALPKVKSPYELVISTFRALGITSVRRAELVVPMASLGQAPFRAPSPQGWPDTAAAWLAPEALERRVEWARAVAVHSARAPDALLALFEPVATDELRTWMRRAPSADAAVALLLASPTFQRR